MFVNQPCQGLKTRRFSGGCKTNMFVQPAQNQDMIKMWQRKALKLRILTTCGKLYSNSSAGTFYKITFSCPNWQNPPHWKQVTEAQPLQPDSQNKPTHWSISAFHCSVTQVVYFTAVFPYFILFALLVNNVQLPGAKKGILYFVTPVWSKLFEVKVRLLINE